MPTYSYRCEKCRQDFSEIESFSEHGKKRVKCPKCHSEKVRRVFDACLVKTSKKS